MILVINLSHMESTLLTNLKIFMDIGICYDDSTAFLSNNIYLY